MSERRNDTTEPDERGAPLEPERAPRNYYYDDGTGYEVYDPAQDEDEPGESDRAEAARDDEPARR